MQMVQMMMNDDKWWMMNDEPSQEGSSLFFLASGDPDSALASAWRKAVVQGLGVSNSEVLSSHLRVSWSEPQPFPHLLDMIHSGKPT